LPVIAWPSNNFHRIINHDQHGPRFSGIAAHVPPPKTWAMEKILSRHNTGKHFSIKQNLISPANFLEEGMERVFSGKS
jgi:hypothetical protein